MDKDAENHILELSENVLSIATLLAELQFQIRRLEAFTGIPEQAEKKIPSLTLVTNPKGESDED